MALPSAFRRGKDRRGTPADWLVIGLGNPGDTYRGTRHNVGAEVVERLAEPHGGLRPSRREESLAADIRLGDLRVVAAFPQTFMNDSGLAGAELVKRRGVDDPSRVVVVHDELDLAPGTVRVKAGGGLAGHNGLRSLRQHLGTAEFVRVRIGVGRPPGRGDGAGHVLSRPPAVERTELDVGVAEATDAVVDVITRGVDEAMNRWNRRDR